MTEANEKRSEKLGTVPSERSETGLSPDFSRPSKPTPPPTGWALKGHEDLEISTQIVIQNALNRGIDVEILDRKSNFIRLRKNGRTEYVKQASETSKDSYITFLIMENKTVSKCILQESGFRVPEGQAFSDPEEALRYTQSISGKKIVIKPTTTNFGIGIAILDAPRETSVVKSAIADALSHAETIIVEEFLAGTEYRFLVIDYETVAVVQRVPANVLGDGTSNIERLVNEKNRDPRRGKGHITPLEIIEMGETEAGVLSEDYGYQWDTIPGKDETVFLRRNSNVSTGGDSIDVTDSTDASYTRIAERAAQCVDARICGLDMILPDRTREGDWGILELNFNPCLYMHDYPYQGENRHVGEKILDLLGF